MAYNRETSKPLFGSVEYNDTFQGGVSGSFKHIYTSTLDDVEAAMAEILVSEYPVGSLFDNAPFLSCMILSRSLVLIGDTKDTYQMTVSVGPTTIDPSKPWLFQYNSSLSSAETNIDASNKAITVGTLTNTNKPEGTGPNEDEPPYLGVPKTTVVVQKMFPSLRISADGVLNSNPLGVFRSIIGKLNSSNFTMDGYTYPAGTLMLVGANARALDSSGVYSVSYEFEFRPNKYDWECVVVAIDPKTGQPYQGIEGTLFSDNTTIGDAGTVPFGSVGYKMYNSASFASLF